MTMLRSSVRRAVVRGVDDQGNLILDYLDSGGGGAPVPRPSVGSGLTGLHSVPPQNAHVAVVGEVWDYPCSAVTASDGLGTPAALQPGETAIYALDGRVLLKASNDGTTTLWSKPGYPSTTVDAAGNLTVGGTIGGALLRGVRQVIPAIYATDETDLNATGWQGLGGGAGLDPAISVAQGTSVLAIVTGALASNDTTTVQTITIALRFPDVSGPVPTVPLGSFSCPASPNGTARATIAGVGVLTPAILGNQGGPITASCQLLYQVTGGTWSVKAATSPTTDQIAMTLIEFAP